MSTVFSRCTTTGCENERVPPAAFCPACMRTLGYGEPHETGRLVEPVKTMMHLPKVPPQRNLGAGRVAHTYSDQQAALKLAELTERLGVLERVVASYQQAPPQHVPPHFKDLDAFTPAEDIVIPPFLDAVVAVVKPRNAEGGVPKYCAIHAHRTGYPSDVAHLRLGGVLIAQCPQMQFCDPNCDSYVSTKFYDLRYGAPVNWALITIYQNSYATFYLRNMHPFSVTASIELWCDVQALYDERERRQRQHPASCDRSTHLPKPRVP